MESTHGAGCRYHTGCHGVISFIRNSWSAFPKLRWLCHLTQLRRCWEVSEQAAPLSSPILGSLLRLPNPCIPNHHPHPKFRVISRRSETCQKSQQLRELQSSRTDYLLPPQGKEWKSKEHQEFSEQDTSGSSGHTKERMFPAPHVPEQRGLRVWGGDRW